jgi:catecholate siderophore receptor
MLSRLSAVAAFAYLVVSSPLAAQHPAAAPRDSTAPSADSSRTEPRNAYELKRIKVVERTSAGRGYLVASSRTGTRTNTLLRDTPQAATVLTRSLIADQAMQSMADVVRYVPGATPGLGEGHRDQPTLRGNSTTADFCVDGVRDDAQYLRDLYNVERIEVIKGSNAMTFGRGGGGGIFNRVSKQAGWTPIAAITVEGGSFDHKRETIDVGMPIGTRFSARLNGMLERSGSYRDYGRIAREGLSPTATILAGAGTLIRLDYERFHDERNVDRGVPSYQNLPFRTDPSTFFGDPAASWAHARVDAVGVTVEHTAGSGVELRNTTRLVRYDKFYQNVFAGGPVNAAGTQVNLTGYNNVTKRDNVFNQTDVTTSLVTGAVKHLLLVGGELARQSTDNLRNTAYFTGGSATSLTVGVDAPARATGATFRQSASDADNQVRVDVGAGYLQDQLALGPHWQAIAGLRVERFDLRVHDNRNGQELSRADRLVSPRGGLIFKPVEQASLYASYSVSHLPSAGEQFSSLTATTQTLEPERFTNRELGAKWDVTPALSITGALFQLDRTNSAAHDPADATRMVQTGAQRTTGYELGVNGDVTGRWQIAGGYGVQRATLLSATTAGRDGATAPLVPHHTLSLWNKVQLLPSFGAGLGVVHQARMYASIDNSVAIPAFTRVDAGVFVGLPGRSRLQVNVENVLGTEYYATAQGNNNIMPGAPRTVRLSVTAAP